MKKIIVAVVLLVSAFFTTVQANNGEKSARILKSGEIRRGVEESFKRKFPKAQYARWQQVNETDLYLVRFLHNDEGLLAYVDSEGEVLATVRAVDSQSLPITIAQTLSSRYGSYSMTESLEMVLHGELNYIITMVNEKSRITLKVLANGDASEVKKEKLRAAGK